MTGWASWQVALVIASFLAAMFLAGAALAAVKINTPEPRHAARADDDTAEWMHRLVGPARVMADPALTRLAVLGRAVADAARGRDVMACGCAPGGPSCEWWAGQLHPLNVSGPAVVPDPPAAEPSTPRGGGAGPETQRRPFEPPEPGYWPLADEDLVFTDDSHQLPPVDQAAHLQPIEWADATGSFAAVCEADHG